MKIFSKSAKDTLKIGRRIAGNLEKGDILCLFGNLGAGKTVLTKGIASGVGISVDKVISPTFVLIREYSQARIPLYHFDLYRMACPADIINLGYEEYLYNDGVTVIEWADKLGELLPKEYLKIELSVKADKQRFIEFIAFGRRYKQLLKDFYEDIRD